jgi:hypothetical protein
MAKARKVQNNAERNKLFLSIKKRVKKVNMVEVLSIQE